jgi:hypothetical protein
VYVGHYAIGLAIKARRPEVPALPILLGVGFIDILDGLFVMAGIDRMTPNLAAGPYLFFDLTFIDWDHSLLMAIFWSLVWGACFLKDRSVALVAALAALSHFVADWPVHNRDLAWFPYSANHMGLGLWGRLGTGAWVLEGLFAAALVSYAWRSSARRGVSLVWPAVLLFVLFMQLSPWFSPMRFIAQLDEPAAHLVGGALVTLGFILPGLLLTWLLDRADRAASRDDAGLGA